MPDSVLVELERSRGVLEASLSDDATDTLVENLVALRMLGADAHLLGAIVQRLSLLAPRLTGPGGLEAWLTAVREVTEQARHCTLALLSSSEEVLRHGSPAELLMWARLGLRHGQRSGEKMDPADTTEAGSALAHFELRSRESAQGMASGERGERRADLASSKARLTHLLRALFDMVPALLTVEQGLATRRPFVSNLGLHLPEVGRGLRGALAQRWYDAAALHAAAHLRHSLHRFERGSLKPIQIALVGVLEDARVELIAIAELPGLRRLWGGFHHVEPAHGGSFVVLMLRLARALLDPAHADPHPWVARGRRMFFELTDEGRAPGRLTPAALREIASLLGNDIGQMRLQFNDREYVVEPAYRDDNAYLWLPEEDTPPQVQTVADEVPVPPDEVNDDRDDSDDIEHDADDGAPAPRPRAVASGERPSDRPPLARFQYPEWDRLVGDYRSAWCTVLESRPMPGDPQPLQRSVDAHAALLLRLERVLRAGRLRERVKLRAQLRGDDLDIDAAVRSAIERRTQHAPGQKVHQRFDRRERDVAALVLLDSSASTADALAGSVPDPLPDTRAGTSTSTGRTVLDLAREAALLTTLTLLSAGDRCAIHAFASNGRHEVRYERALDFDEALGPRAIARLAGVRSHLSTRMGAALRHAATLLAAQPHHKRLLLFVTDGEPHDIDIFDRRYLVEDARRAVLEAGRLGLAVFCVSLDPAADDYVRAIFGAGNYRVLDRIDSLPRILPAMVLRLTR
ncbi:MAG: VWA domain-containing protein [Bacteriovorax sp.]|nr:VWA domain-containing protein [Rhizobacter sp.]